MPRYVKFLYLLLVFFLILFCVFFVTTISNITYTVDVFDVDATTIRVVEVHADCENSRSRQKCKKIGISSQSGDFEEIRWVVPPDRLVIDHDFGQKMYIFSPNKVQDDQDPVLVDVIALSLEEWDEYSVEGEEGVILSVTYY